MDKSEGGAKVEAGFVDELIGRDDTSRGKEIEGDDGGDFAGGRFAAGSGALGAIRGDGLIRVSDGLDGHGEKRGGGGKEGGEGRVVPFYQRPRRGRREAGGMGWLPTVRKGWGIGQTFAE